MLRYRSEDNEIINKVLRIKGKCPNFYVMGTSTSAMENLGVRLAETIEENNLIPFKGLVKHFTIKMPYFDDVKSANDFMSHLQNSYSIARDCYDSYSGIILVELSKEWIKKGYNSTFNYFLDFVLNYEQVCFIILALGVKGIEEEKVLYSEFTRCGVWMKIQSKTPSIDQCVDLFQKFAKEYGFDVLENAKKVLAEKLKIREEIETENIVIVQQLLKQIIFNRSVEQDNNKVIDENDIVFIAGTEKKTQIKKMGFIIE